MPQSLDNPLLFSHTTVWNVTQHFTKYTRQWFASMGHSSRHMSIKHCAAICSIPLSVIERQNIQYGCATLPIKTTFKQYNKFWPYRIFLTLPHELSFGDHGSTILVKILSMTCLNEASVTWNIVKKKQYNLTIMNANFLNLKNNKKSKNCTKIT